MSIQIEDPAVSHRPMPPIGELNRPNIRILVVDDQRLFRESLAGVLGMEPSFEVVGTAGDEWRTIELARQLLPDVILMDVKMPYPDGIAAIRQIKIESPKSRIILLTTFMVDRYIFDSLEAGASGYLLKDTSTAGLACAIRAVYAGEPIPVPSMASRMMQLLRKQNADKGQRNDCLTVREMETLVLVAKGMVVKEIARTLAICEKTVRNHIGNIYRKLGVYDRSQIALYAVKKGLIDMDAV